MKSSTYAVIALATLFRPSSAASCSAKENVKVTFYGWPDNSPPGPANAFDCGRGKTADGQPIAGGTGAYADPISFATATDNDYFPRCGIIYIPSFRKYFRNEDDCAECKSDFDNTHTFHIDLWTGSNTQGGGSKQIECENKLPGGQLTIINNPPSGLEVDTISLFDITSDSCSSTTYPVSDGPSLCDGSSKSNSSSNSDTSPSSSTSMGPTSLIISPPIILSTSASPTSSVSDPTGNQKTSVKLDVTSRQTPTTFATATVRSASTPKSSPGCTWEGHCLGAPCKDENDCDGENVCGGGDVCIPPSRPSTAEE